jgi:hypothetical protein
MLVAMRDIATIKLYPQNPRHNDHAVDAVKMGRLLWPGIYLGEPDGMPA